jgi:hypothetical protein
MKGIHIKLDKKKKKEGKLNKLVHRPNGPGQAIVAKRHRLARKKEACELEEWKGEMKERELMAVAGLINALPWI